jgi:hypothetical protein
MSQTARQRFILLCFNLSVSDACLEVVACLGTSLLHIRLVLNPITESTRLSSNLDCPETKGLGSASSTIMEASIDNKLLRSLDGSSCASHFRKLRENGLSDSAITAHLLGAVRSQSLSPLPLMSVWLSFAQSPTTIKTALGQSFSLTTRKLAIKAFGKLLNSRRWRLLWTEFGGVEGIVELFTQLSIIEVNQITTIIGHQIKAGRDLERDVSLSDLLRALIASDVPAAMHHTSDQRPLVGKYMEMLPACDVSFVEDMLCQKVEGVPDHTWRMQYFSCHSAMIAKSTLQSVFNAGGLPYHRLGHFLQFCLNDMQQGFPAEAGCSVSMSFGLQLLKRMTTEKQSWITNNTFLHSLMEPLLGQTWNRRKSLGLSKLKEVIDLGIVYIRQRRESFRPLSIGDGSFVYWTLRYWSLDSSLFEDALTFSMTMLSVQETTKAVTDVAKPLLGIVQIGLRYRLLRKLFAVISIPSVDLDSVDELLKLEDVWDHEIFTTLPREAALPLLMRLRQAKPELGLCTPLEGRNFPATKRVIFCPTAPTSRKIDTDLLYHILNRGQEGALASVEKFLLQQKNKAITSREQTDRAFYAKATLFAAVASGSLVLLKDTVIWLRRYTRDALTVKSLYDDSVFCVSEMKDLLTAIPEIPSRQDSAMMVAEAVSDANAIMICAYETVCQALREPSFFAGDWRAPLSLFQSIIERRLERVKALQRVLRLSDKQLYDTVWRSTLEMLVRVERSAVEGGNAALDFDRPAGPLGFRGVGKIDPKKATPASFRLVDDLASARDEIWRDVRRLKFPAAATLTDPWPRGLSLPFLRTPLEVATAEAGGHTPYLAARSESIVFIPKMVAIADPPEDKEIQTAIGQFFESYSAALRIYVLQGGSAEVRQGLLQKAWLHAVRFFTRDYMTQDEKIRYVNLIFADALPHHDLPKSSLDYSGAKLWPCLPDDLDADYITEWNPLSTKPPNIKGVSVDSKLIDSMVSTYANGLSQFWILPNRMTTLPDWSAGNIWMRYRYKNALKNVRKLPVKVREGLVISRLLYLDSKIGGTSRILVSSFPSSQDVRYPALFLDSEFLLDENHGDLRLLLFSPHVPLDIVRSLANRTMKELVLAEDCIENGGEQQQAAMPEDRPQCSPSDPPGAFSSSSRFGHTPPGFGRARGRGMFEGRGSYHSGQGNDPDDTYLVKLRTRIMELERILYELVGFLASSDRPQMAADLSVRIIMDRPDASSWHRKLLSIGYLRSLPHADVQVFFSNFVKVLSDRLDEQEAHKDDKGWKKPYVKVTTLKYVAQLLEGVEFISRVDAVNILIKLYGQAKHIDVRVAAVESLLGMLSCCKDQTDALVANAIIQGLRATIPLLGGPSERRQYNEEDWLVADSTGVLPEVSDDKPMTNLLIDAVARRKWSINLSYRKTIMREVLEPIIEASSLYSERWVKLFSTKHEVVLGGSALHTELLSYPIKPSIIESLLTLCPELTPAHILQKYHKHILAMIHLSPELGALKHKILTDSELRSSNDGKTFLSLYNKGLNAYRDATVPLSLLREKWKHSLLEHDGVTLEMVQKMLCDLPPEFLACYDAQPKHFDMFIAHLQPTLSLHDEGRKFWTHNIKPVLESIVSSIEHARKYLTDSGEGTSPSVLPSTFKFKLWLLDWPLRSQTDTKDFTASIISIIEDLTSGYSPLYHTKYHELSNMLQQLPSIDHYVQVANELGDGIGTRGQLCRALIEELQERLLLNVKGSTVKPAVMQHFKEIARLWVSDKGEETRRRGFNLERVAASLRVFVGSEPSLTTC